jgi:acyl-CoA synthetase (AMP-forming)/AMP-acid ligase II
MARVRDIAQNLTTLGVQRADRVAIVLPNGPDAALSFLGVAAVAAAAPLNPAYSRDEFAFYLGDLQAKLAIIDANVAPAAVAAATALGVRVISAVAGVGDPGPASTRPATTTGREERRKKS